MDEVAGVPRVIEPLYGRFTDSPRVREMPRCSFGGHSAKYVVACDGPKCDADICEFHSVVCLDCGDVLCPRCGVIGESGWCERCEAAGLDLLLLAWWMDAALALRKDEAA